MNLELDLLLDLDLDLDQVIQSMWPPYKAIKCGARANEEILSKCLECRQGCKKEEIGQQPPCHKSHHQLYGCTESQFREFNIPLIDDLMAHCQI